MEIKKTTNKTKSNSYADLVELIYDRVTGSYGIVGICDKDLGNKKATPLELSKAKKGIVLSAVGLGIGFLLTFIIGFMLGMLEYIMLY
jgi:hypothetical protein